MTKAKDSQTGITVESLRKELTYDIQTGKFYRANGEPADRLRQSGYAAVYVGGYRYRAHRLAWFYMTGKWPPDDRQIDHINGVRSDNRWYNLRLATNQDNQANTPCSKNNRTGRKGVYPHKGRYRAKINVGKRQIHLGTFSDPEEAGAAYALAAKAYFGDFGRAS